MTIKIQEASFETIGKINKLIPEFEQQTSDYFEDRCKNKLTHSVVAYIDGVPAGYMVSYDKEQNKRSFYCWMTAVLPEYRRKGVLSSLMKDLFVWAKEHGFAEIGIKTRNKLRGMLSFLVYNDFQFLELYPKQPISENEIVLIRQI